MKFFTLLFVAVLSATMFIGCERTPPLPVKDVTDPTQINTQFAQNALSDLADTADKRAFINLANAASSVAETLAIDDGTSVEPIFSKIAKLADEIAVLDRAFVEAGCEIELQKFAEASIDAVKAYTVRDAAGMEQSLQNLAKGAMAAETTLQQFPAENVFVPFAFGYGISTGNRTYGDTPDVIWINYDATRPVNETRTAVFEFLTNKGYPATEQLLHALWVKYPPNYEAINLGADVYLPLVMRELVTIPGVAVVVERMPAPDYEGGPPPDEPPLLSYEVKTQQVINRVRTMYNEVWCQGNFAVIDSLLIEASGLAFFDYAFVRNLADIYAEEIPEKAERIRTNRFSLQSIAENFLYIYFQDSEKTLDELIERFRQSAGHVSLEQPTTGWRYHLSSDYWEWYPFYYGIENVSHLPSFFLGYSTPLN